LAIPAVHLIATLPDTSPVPAVAQSASVEAVMLTLPPLPGAVTTGLMTIWALTLAFALLRIAHSCCEIERLKRTSAVFDLGREARLTMWMTARDSSRRKMVLRRSEGRAGACALGLAGPPVILVSGSLVDALSDDELDEIVMHEQAHLDRRDDWLKLLRAVVGSLAGLHPATRFILRQIDAECEAACDDRVVARTGDARRYAWTLAAARSGSAAPTRQSATRFQMRSRRPTSVGHEPRKCRDSRDRRRWCTPAHPDSSLRRGCGGDAPDPGSSGHQIGCCRIGRLARLFSRRRGCAGQDSARGYHPSGCSQAVG
jgi:beta-lactamase regulating signal transducer with metallopeptidase domain